MPEPTSPCPPQHIFGIPFSSSQEAWFWFILCHQATHDGARICARVGSTPRPCEPVDILCIVDSLHRCGRLFSRHLDVLARYGQMQIAPDEAYGPQKKDARLWRDAHEIMQEIFIQKGIIEQITSSIIQDYQIDGGIYP